MYPKAFLILSALRFQHPQEWL